MTKFRFLFLLLPIIILSFYACEEEPMETIDQDLLPYVERFIFEANERDYRNSDGNPLSIDSLDIEITFTNISDPAVIGRCQRDENGVSQAIAIDPVYWKQSEELVKEYIMFHELGHCVLSRNHTTDADANNICLSIMEPGTGELCMSNYTTSTRANLLDELFNF